MYLNVNILSSFPSMKKENHRSGKGKKKRKTNENGALTSRAHSWDHTLKGT